MHLSHSDTWCLEWSTPLIKTAHHPAFKNCLPSPYDDFKTSLLQFVCSSTSHKYDNYNKAPYIFLSGCSLAPYVRLIPTSILAQKPG